MANRSENQRNRQSSHTAKTKMSTSKQQQPLLSLNTFEEKPKTKVNIYMRLLKAMQVPVRKGSVELQFQQVKGTIRKMECSYTHEATVKLSDWNKGFPTFSITVEQDSLDEMNIFSDNPLLITLYERDYEALEEEGEEEDVQGENRGEEAVEAIEVIRPIGQASIDLLQFFQRSRLHKTLHLFLYPMKHTDEPTCKITIEFYTLLPLVKEMQFTNIIFLTLESLYNLSATLMDSHEELQVKLLLRSVSTRASKKPNGEVEICSYRNFTRNIISEQDTNVVWETAKSFVEGSTLGIQTGNKIPAHRLFRLLHGTEGVEFRFKDIQRDAEEALTCNSMHRFVFDATLTDLLANCVDSKEQELVLQLCLLDHEVLLEGTIDLSIFMYPKVNAIRLAVALRPLATNGRRSSKRTSRPSRQSKDLLSQASAGLDEHSDRPMFAILNICLLSPITEAPKPIPRNASHQNIQLKVCKKSAPEVSYEGVSKQIIVGETYTEFDETMKRLMRHIIECKLFDINDATSKKFFCDNADEVRARVLNCIAVDFNQRVPTKNNIDFTRLMTTVYKELVERLYILVHAGNLTKPKVPQEELIQQLTHIKFLNEAGNPNLAETLLDKLKEDNPQSNDLNFYLFLYDVELGNFEQAKAFVQTKEVKGELIYFVNFIEVYIRYMEDRENEESYNEAVQNLFVNLKAFMNYHPMEFDAWLLLYCLYRQSGYRPGTSYARWRSEGVSDLTQSRLPQLPKSRWEIYLSFPMPIQGTREKLFYHAYETFVKLGMLKFAEFIVPEFANELKEEEYQFIATTFKILLNEPEPRATIPALFKRVDVDTTKLAQVQVNGNLEYYRGNLSMAALFYGAIVFLRENADDIPFDQVQLSLLRHAYMSMNDGEYQLAARSFERFCNDPKGCFHTAFGLGLAYFKLENWALAEHYFSECTTHKIFIPDIWAYLAIVNLKLGQNATALDCWVQAHINPNKSVSEEVLSELSKIDVDSVNLYVDRQSIFQNN